MKKPTRLSFELLHEQMEIMSAPETELVNGGLRLDQLQNILNEMNSKGITHLSSDDLAARGTSFEQLANGVPSDLPETLFEGDNSGGGFRPSTMPPTSLLEDPTAKEIEWAFSHPGAATVFNNNAEQSLTKAQSLFSADPNSLHNGKGDAFRHAYWSALNAKYNSTLAGDFGLVHENRPNNPTNERNMDIANNNYGIAFAKANPNMTSAQLATALYQAAINGKLTTIPIPD